MEQILDFLTGFSGPWAYLAVFAVLLACGLGVPIPEDITLIAAGYLAYHGNAKVGAMIAVGMFGVLFGDGFIFWLGRRYGRALTRRWIFHKLLPDDRLELVRRQFEKRGDRILFAARFMPGLRAPVYFSAGTLHVPFRKFLIYDGSAALLSVPAIVWAAYHFGGEIDAVVETVRHVEYGILAVIVLAALLLVGKWYRARRRERREA